jgi:hypothetical protein
MFPARNAPEPLLFLSLDDIKSLRLELADTHREVNRSTTSNTIEDKFVIVLVAITRDVIKLRSPPLPLCTHTSVATSRVDFKMHLLASRGSAS